MENQMVMAGTFASKESMSYLTVLISIMAFKKNQGMALTLIRTSVNTMVLFSISSEKVRGR